jgi:hypothetical protein
MSSKRSPVNSQDNRVVSRFDRGSANLHHFLPLNNPSSISLQLLFFALMELLALQLTGNDPIKSRLLFQLQLHFLQISKILPASMNTSVQSIRKLNLFHRYVRVLRESIETALSLLEQEYKQVLLSTTPTIRIDIPQVDIQLHVPVPVHDNGTIMMADFDNIVVYRYVQDFNELNKLGKGAFGTMKHTDDIEIDRDQAVCLPFRFCISGEKSSR